jgi:hypothetical protein
VLRSFGFPLLRSWRVGQWVQANDNLSGWYDAKVIDERGEGTEREVLVHYNGWKKRFDQWILATSQRILGEHEELPEDDEHDWGGQSMRLDRDVFAVKAILGKKHDREGNVFYMVEWEGVDKEGNAWPRSKIYPLDAEGNENLSADLIDEYENPPAIPPTPYTLAQPELVSPSIADTLVGEWVEQVGRSAMDLLARQREEWAARKIYSIKPCPPWLFIALHRAFEQQGDVSGIRAVRGHRGGKFVEDQFDVVATDLVERMVGAHNTQGHGALVLRENGTAVMLVPPLEFKFKTVRVEVRAPPSPPPPPPPPPLASDPLQTPLTYPLAGSRISWADRAHHDGAFYVPRRPRRRPRSSMGLR